MGSLGKFKCVVCFVNFQDYQFNFFQDFYDVYLNELVATLNMKAISVEYAL